MHESAKIETPDFFAEKKNKLMVVKMFQSLKNGIYNGLMTLSSLEQPSVLTMTVVTVIQWLQLVFVFFVSDLYLLWGQDSATKIANSIAAYIHITPVWEKISFMTFAVAVIVYTVITMLAIGLFYVIQHSIKERSAGWNLIRWLNSTVMLVMPAICFIPFIEGYFAVFDCIKNEDDVLVMDRFRDVRCFEGMHLIAFIISILGLVLYLLYVGFISSLYFTTTSNAKVSTACAFSFTRIILHFYVLFNLVLLNFMNQYSIEYVFTLSNVCFSFYFWLCYFIQRPYYNKTISKLWACCSTVLFWSSLMLLSSQVVGEKYLGGSFIMWIATSVIIIVIAAVKDENKISLLLTPNRRLSNNRKLMEQLYYMLKLWAWIEVDENAAALVDGYVDTHSNICDIPECPVQKREPRNKENTLDFKIAYRRKSREYFRLLLEKYFQDTIERYADNIRIRLEYLFFLVEQVDNKQRALFEIEALMKLPMNFQESFMVIKYQKILRRAGDEVKADFDIFNDEEEVVNEVAFNYVTNNLFKAIEQTSLLYLDLWTEIGEEKFNKTKVFNIVQVLCRAKKHTMRCWQVFKSLFEGQKAQVMIIYGKFLVSIVNYYDEGEELIKSGKDIINLELKKKADLNYFRSSDTASNFSLATIIISGNSSKIGVMTGVNSQTCAIFGYTQKELIGKNIRILMPKVLAVHHNSYVRKAVHLKRLNYFRKERLQFGLTRNGYIVPVLINLKQTQCKETQYVANLKVLKESSAVAIFLTDADGDIIGLSYGCITLFGINIRMIEKSSAFDDYFKGLFNQKEAFINENEIKVDEAYLPNLVPNANSHIVLEVRELQYSMINKPLYSFTFKRKISMADELMIQSGDTGVYNFQFKYNRKLQVVKATDNHAERDNEDEGNESGFLHSDKLKNKNKKQGSLHDYKFYDYAEDIKTLRLENGKPVEILEEYFEADDQSSKAKEKSVFDLGNRDDKVDTINYEDMCAEQIYYQKQLEERKLPRFLRCCIVFFNILVLLTIAVIVADYVVKKALLSQVRKYFAFQKTYAQEIYEIQMMVSYGNDLVIMNNVNADYIYDDTLEKLKDCIPSIDNLEKELVNQVLLLKHGNDVRALLNQSVMLNHPEISTSSINLTELIKQFLANSYRLGNLDPSKIIETDPSYIFIAFTGVNELWTAMLSAINGVIDLSLTVINSVFPFIILSSVYTLLAVLGLVVLFITLKKKHSLVEKTLSFFLELKNDKIKLYEENCEVFLQQFQVSDRENIHIEDEYPYGAFREKDDDTHFTKYKRKKFEGRIKFSLASLLVYFILVVCIITANFLNHYQIDRSMKTVSSFQEEFRTTIVTLALNIFTENALKFYTINENAATIAGIPKQEFIASAAQSLYVNESEFMRQKLRSAGYHSQIYNKLAFLYFNKSPCVLAEDEDAIYTHDLPRELFLTICAELKQRLGVKEFTDGVTMVNSRYQEHVRWYTYNYLKLEKSDFKDNSIAELFGCKSNDPKLRYCTLNSRAIQNMYAYKELIFNNVIATINDNLFSTISNSFLSSVANQQLAVALGIIGFIILSYIFMMLKFYNENRKKLKLLNNILLIIPYDSVQSSRALKEKLGQIVHLD